MNTPWVEVIKPSGEHPVVLHLFANGQVYVFKEEDIPGVVTIIDKAEETRDETRFVTHTLQLERGVHCQPVFVGDTKEWASNYARAAKKGISPDCYKRYPHNPPRRPFRIKATA